MRKRELQERNEILKAEIVRLRELLDDVKIANEKRMNAAKRLLSLKGKRLEAWAIPSGNIAVAFLNCEIKEGIFLKSDFGVGKTFEDACEDYLSKICGQTLVFNACSASREEVRVL